MLANGARQSSAALLTILEPRAQNLKHRLRNFLDRDFPKSRSEFALDFARRALAVAHDLCAPASGSRHVLYVLHLMLDV
jgi:hypothetical protein